MCSTTNQKKYLIKISEFDGRLSIVDFVNFLAPDSYSDSAYLAFFYDQMSITVDVRFIIVHLVNEKFHFYVKQIHQLVLGGDVKNNSKSID